MTRLVVLDRDGVINHESVDFIKSPSEWLPIEGSLEAIARLTDAGFIVAVATNQSGIGRKLFSEDVLKEIHEKMHFLVEGAGGKIDTIWYCPHLPDAGCRCRKPAPGMFFELADHYGVDLSGVPVVGDSERDIQAAIAAGARPILVLTGNGSKTRDSLAAQGKPVETFDSLAVFVDRMLGSSDSCG